MSQNNEKRDLILAEAPPRARPTLRVLTNEALKTVGAPIERKSLRAYGRGEDYDDEPVGDSTHPENDISEAEAREEIKRAEAVVRREKQKRDRINKQLAYQKDCENRTREALDSGSSAIVEGLIAPSFVIGPFLGLAELAKSESLKELTKTLGAKVAAEAVKSTAGAIAVDILGSVSYLFGGYIVGRVMRTFDQYLQQNEKAQQAIWIADKVVYAVILGDLVRTVGTAIITGGVSLAFDWLTISTYVLPFIQSGLTAAGYWSGRNAPQVGLGKAVRKVIARDNGETVKRLAKNADMRAAPLMTEEELARI